MSNPSDYRLDGRYELIEELGAGSAGIVWHARHTHRDQSVALKFIHDESAQHETLQRRFQREVRAQAALDHPGILRLYDYGEVGADDVAHIGTRVTTGAPYLSMEFARRGPLKGPEAPQDWQALRESILQILDALAYAHARGVIHRDLKPENLLCFPPEQPEHDRQIKLADFGLAHALDRSRAEDTQSLSQPSAGTPLYMSPEQLNGHWRRFGPWTDLYQLGCVVWEYVCGRPPFRGDFYMEVAVKHLSESPPKLDPNFAVPRRLEAWVHTMMAKSAEARYRRAADAATALRRLDDTPADTTAEPAGPATLADPSSTPDIAGTRQAPGGLPNLLEEDSSPEMGSGADASGRADQATVARNTLPATWRRNVLRATTNPEDYRLWGLREVPFVGRQTERDRLWATLGETVGHRRLTCAVIEGRAGTGKSRLARWVARRAHEVGAVTLLKADHLPKSGSDRGLRHLLEQHFQTWNLDRSSTFNHLKAELGRLPELEPGSGQLQDDARALTEFLRPTDGTSGPDDGPCWQFGSDEERHALLARTLERLTQRRPAVVWLDDIQWGQDSLEWARFLLDEHRDLPATLLLTARPVRSAAADTPAEIVELYEHLLERDGIDRLTLEPLADDAQRELVEGMLPLDDALTDTLVERTEGNPLFAVQIVNDWVERNELESDGELLRLSHGDPEELPSAIHELWQRRVDRIVDAGQGDHGEARRALEIAATLGRHVRSDEWTAACSAADIDIPPTLRERLLRSGLATEEPDGLFFSHALLVDSLRRMAAEAGRLADHHRACADVMEARSREQARNPRIAERLAEHLVGAERPEQALEPLAEAVDRAFRTEAHGELGRLQRRRREVIAELEISDDDVPVLRFRCDEAWRLRTDGQLEEALDILETLEQEAERRDLDALLGRVLRGRTWTSMQSGDVEAAAQAARRWLKISESLGDPADLSRAHYAIGWTHWARGDLEAAGESFKTAGDYARQAGDTVFGVTADRMRAHIFSHTGDLDRAEKLLDELLETARREGALNVEANLRNELGELHRQRQDWQAARDAYERDLEIRHRIGDRGDLEASAINLAMCQLASGVIDEAEARFSKLDGCHSEGGSVEISILGTIGLLGCAAARGDREGVREQLASCRTLLDTFDVRIHDFPWLATLAVEQARETLPNETASELRTLAADLWRAVDRDDKADRVATAEDG